MFEIIFKSILALIKLRVKSLLRYDI